MSKYKDNAREALSRGYWVDGDGVVWSRRGERKCNKQKNGLLRFSIHMGRPRRRVNVLVHQLVALVMFGDRALASDVAIIHKDRDKENNRPDNIELGAPVDAQYLIPAFLRSLYAANAASKLRRLTMAQVIELRAMRAAGAKLKEICERFEIAKSTASYIINHKTYG